MNITILTYGSRGDVQPFVALALGLKKAGHSVRLAAPQRFTNLIAQVALPFSPLPGDPEEISARLNDAGGNVIGMIRAIFDYVFSIAEPVARAAFDACEGADLLVHSFLFTTGGHAWAHAHGIPDVSVQTFPIFAPTRAFPMVAAPDIPSGALSYFSHWLNTQIYWQGGRLGFRRLRAAAPDVFNFELHWPFDSRRARQPMSPLIFAFSPAVISRPADWMSPHIHTPGYFFLDTAEAYEPSQGLVDFLLAGEPPVCVTFGSMVNREAERIHAIVRTALAKAGKRAIFLTGWGSTIRYDQHPCILYLDTVPHDWLLPRCSTVIHHGGAGTTAAGLRAGIPNLVLPHAADQPFWGRRVVAIGAGSAPLPLSKLTVDTLGRALREMDEPRLRDRAARVGELLRAEDGVDQAVHLIEQHASQFYQLSHVN
jgi:sterol 3beta-glucosyltransferase